MALFIYGRCVYYDNNDNNTTSIFFFFWVLDLPMDSFFCCRCHDMNMTAVVIINNVCCAFCFVAFCCSQHHRQDHDAKCCGIMGVVSTEHATGNDPSSDARALLLEVPYTVFIENKANYTTINVMCTHFLPNPVPWFWYLFFLLVPFCFLLFVSGVDFAHEYLLLYEVAVSAAVVCCSLRPRRNSYVCR